MQILINEYFSSLNRKISCLISERLDEVKAITTKIDIRIIAGAVPDLYTATQDKELVAFTGETTRPPKDILGAGKWY